MYITCISLSPPLSFFLTCLCTTSCDNALTSLGRIKASRTAPGSEAGDISSPSVDSHDTRLCCIRTRRKMNEGRLILVTKMSQERCRRHWSAVVRGCPMLETFEDVFLFQKILKPEEGKNFYQELYNIVECHKALARGNEGSLE